MVAVDGREEQPARDFPRAEAVAGDTGSSVLKLSIMVRATEVQVQLTVDKLDAPGVAQGTTIQPLATGGDPSS